MRFYLFLGAAVSSTACLYHGQSIDPMLGRVVLSGTPSAVVADGVNSATVTLHVAELDGSDASNVPVQFLTPAGPVGAPVITDANGTAMLTLRETIAGNQIITAQLEVGNAAIQVDQWTTIRFVAPGNVAIIDTPALNGNAPVADGVTTVPITVVIVDPLGNPVVGQNVTFSSSTAGVTFTPQTTLTDGAGDATTEVSSTTSGPIVITVTYPGGNPSQPADSNAVTIIFAPDPPNAMQTLFTTSPAAVTADGASTGTLTVIVRDIFGRALANQPVALQSSGTANTLGSPSGPTDANGIFSTTLVSTVAEIKLVTAALSGFTETAAMTFVAGSPNSTLSSIVANPASLAADGTTPTTITVTVKDAFGNLCGGVTVTMHSGNANDIFSPPGGPADASGVLISNLTSTNAQVETVTASESTASESASVTFVTGPLSTFSITGLVSSAEQALWLNPVVTANDAYGNAYMGSITWTSSDANAVLPPIYTFTTGDAGVHTFAGLLQLVTLGPQHVMATDNLGLTAQCNVTVTPSSIASLPIDGGSEWTYSMCAILHNGQIKCWGKNNTGQSGLGDLLNRGNAAGQMSSALAFVPLGTSRTVTQVAVADSLTCALLDTGTVKCWGTNQFGNEGVGDTVQRGSTPGTMGDALPAVNLGTGRTALRVVAGSGTSACALLDTHQVKCWGENSNNVGFGLLGYGDTISRGASPTQMGDNLPTVPLGTGRSVLSVTAGSFHFCALLDSNQIKCWGDNSAGELGLGDTNNRGYAAGQMGNSLPTVSLGTGRSAMAVQAGYNSTCALLDDAQLKCWGNNEYGELGIGDTNNRGYAAGQMGDSLPLVNVGTGRTVLKYSSGAHDNCAILDNAQLKCWGYGAYGVSGDSNGRWYGSGSGTMGDSLPAVNFGVASPSVQVFTSDLSVCALLGNGNMTCWGWNVDGQLGSGNPNDVIHGPNGLPPVKLW